MIKERELVLRYQKYFDDWDTTSAVRSKLNTYSMRPEQLNSELKDKRWFLPAGTPILSHPLLKNIDQTQEQYLLGRFILQFLEYGTVMEHEFVNTILIELALGESGIPLPDRMRTDAFKIYTDEAYHACFNLEASQQMHDYIGLPMSDAWPLQNCRLNGLRKLIPQENSKEKFLVRFAIAVISETIAAKELVESMQGIVVESIYNIFNDHAEDERKHCMYFTTLLEVVWEHFSSEERIYLGKIFPKILKAFVDINKIALFDALEKIEIDRDSAEIIINDSYPENFTIQRALSVASVTFRVFTRLGVFNLPGVREAFSNEGFILDV
jgi:hypothetical protein